MTTQTVTQVLDVLRAMSPGAEMPVQGLDCKVAQHLRRVETDRGYGIKLMLMDTENPQSTLECMWWDCPYTDLNELVACRMFIRSRPAKDNPTNLVGAKFSVRSWVDRKQETRIDYGVEIRDHSTVMKIVGPDGVKRENPFERQARGMANGAGAAPAASAPPPARQAPAPAPPPARQAPAPATSAMAFQEAYWYAWNGCVQAVRDAEFPSGDPYNAAARMTNTWIIAWSEGKWSIPQEPATTATAATPPPPEPAREPGDDGDPGPEPPPGADPFDDIPF